MTTNTILGVSKKPAARSDRPWQQQHEAAGESDLHLGKDVMKGADCGASSAKRGSPITWNMWMTMMRIGSVFLAITLMAAQTVAAPWPGGKRAAVVLTYDDALVSQLDTAIPALDAAGLKGTFFLIGSKITPEQIARWRSASAEGHELGNHTIRHACPQANYPPAKKIDTSETYDVDTMLAEIRTMNTMLTAIDGKPQHSYATPCGQHLAGGVDYLPALRASGLVRYARAADPSEHHFDPMDMPSRFFPANATGADLIAAVQDAERKGGLIVLGFHGVGGDYLSVSAEAHARLLAYLKAHSNTIWVAPFSTVIGYVSSHPGR